MLIACKCLNFVGSTSHIDQKLNQNKTDGDSRDDPNCLQNLLVNELKKQHISRRVNYNCLEFLRQAIGPISDLSTTINHNDLIYKVPLDSWLLYYCINCNKITHGKHKTDQIYLINSKLLTNKAEINSLKTSKSFSTTFDILMIDHQPTTPIQINNDLQFGFNSTAGNQQPLTATGATSNENIFNFQHSNSNSNINSITSMNEYNIASAKIQQQKRLRNLNQMLQQRLQKEISDTDERIRRYSEQQFALLKSFREKSEQEYQLLVSLVNQVPDELKVIDAIDDNTITSNNTVPTMKTHDNTDCNNSNLTNKNTTILTNQIATLAKTKGAIENTRQGNNQQSPSLLVFNKSLNENQQNQSPQSQIPNIETPPGTPENVPMSVGNSPTFRPHHQQQQNSQQNNIYATGQQRPNTLLNNTNDDCLFELDEFEVYQGSDQPQNMCDVEECEDAADALGELSGGISIPKNMGRRGSNSIAKSLPIKIANMGGGTTKYDFEDLDDEVVDDTVDIAASIKALAKSVHGNAVFGELPRPRFSTQI